VIVQGGGSRSVGRREIERADVVAAVPAVPSNETYLPSDATSFYLKGVPFLSAFTGAHAQHHSPRDTADLLDYESLARIAYLMGRIAERLASAPEPPDYVKMPAPARMAGSGGRRAYLGTIPDFSDTSVKGVLLGGVAEGGPAHAAGVRTGDVVVELGGTPVENLYDYQRVLQGVKIGQEIAMVIERRGQRLTMRVVPGSRD
jgi:membrane-associated protease RseP (regulator of RpoE activity)